MRAAPGQGGSFFQEGADDATSSVRRSTEAVVASGLDRPPKRYTWLPIAAPLPKAEGAGRGGRFFVSTWWPSQVSRKTSVKCWAASPPPTQRIPSGVEKETP